MHPDVHRLLPLAAERAERPLLQHAQQLGLRGRRHLGDLVEEQRAAVGEFEAALAARDGAGERALLVAEQLALEQRVRDGRAVERHERLPARWLSWWIVCATSSLPVPDSPLIEHRRGRRRGLLDHLVDLAHLGALADHLAERAALAELPPEHPHLAQRVVPLDDLVEQDLQPLGIDRLR